MREKSKSKKMLMKEARINPGSEDFKDTDGIL